MDTRKIIGANIRTLREEKGLRQSELARMADIFPPTMSNYERGVSMPSPENLSAIAKELDVDVAELIGRSEEEINSIINPEITKDEMMNILFEQTFQQEKLYLFFKKEFERCKKKEKDETKQELLNLNRIVEEQRNKKKLLESIIAEMYLEKKYEKYLERHKKE